MSDLRRDPITGQWVVVSEVRAVRPNEFRQVETRRSDLACAFCVGNEHNTPEAFLELPNTQPNMGPSSWSVRVVPNKYPAFGESPTTFEQADGPYQRADKKGVQEIVIQSPRHVASFSQLNDAELFDSFSAFQSRLKYHSDDASIAHLMLFTNCRAEAGASMEHMHSQIIGTPMISPGLINRFELTKVHFREYGQTCMESIVQWELKQQERIITIDDPWVVFCSFASRWPYQVWIAPQKASSSLQDCSQEDVQKLARLVRDMVDRLERLHDFPAYNVLFHLADNQREHTEHYQWYVEIVPRLTRFAGYELGTGFWINHVPPIEAVKQIRGIQ